jgi:hypothetical protein
MRNSTDLSLNWSRLQNNTLPTSCLNIRITLFFACLEQVREEGPAKVSLVEDEAHKANHGNTASGDLKLQG